MRQLRPALLLLLAAGLAGLACAKKAPAVDPCAAVVCTPIKNGSNVCQAGKCELTCTKPLLPNADHTACLSPNTVDACGERLVKCPVDPNGATACTDGKCVLACTAPRIANDDDSACVPPNTPELCGDALAKCPVDPNGTASCDGGKCVLTCTEPRVPNAEGTACVSPNTPAACGEELRACPTDPKGTAACTDGACVLTCGAPLVPNADGTACIWPNDPVACGPQALACPIDPNGTTACLPDGTCQFTCASGFQPTADGKHCFSSCYTLLKSGQTADGTYAVVSPDGLAHSVSCDMTTDGGGWTVVSPDLVSFTTSARLTGTKTAAADGSAVVAMESDVGVACGNVFDVTTVADSMPWSQIRYTEEFEKKADCYAVFGNQGSPTFAWLNLVPLDLTRDVARNGVLMNPAGDDFQGPTAICTENPQFWNSHQDSVRSLEVIQRRADRTRPAGPATFAACTYQEWSFVWRYKKMAVRDCPMTADACGATCSPCGTPEGATAATCNAGLCEYTCDEGWFPVPGGCAHER